MPSANRMTTPVAVDSTLADAGRSLAADTVVELAGLLIFLLMPWAARGLARLNRVMVRRLLAPREPPHPAS